MSKLQSKLVRIWHAPSVFLSRVEGRGFHVEGEGTKSRVEGNIFFPNFFFLEKVIIDAINVIKNK